jgi:hypothetical protein
MGCPDPEMTGPEIHVPHSTRAERAVGGRRALLAEQELPRALAETEIAARDASNVRLRGKQANFPTRKTIEEFDLAFGVKNDEPYVDEAAMSVRLRGSFGPLSLSTRISPTSRESRGLLTVLFVVAFWVMVIAVAILLASAALPVVGFA